MAALFGAATTLAGSMVHASASMAGPADVTTVAVEGAALPVLDQSVVVTAPQGYCIDPLASLNGGSAAFVMMGPCQAITGELGAPMPDFPGLLTASIDGSAGAVPTHGELARYFESQRGRSALSRSGDPEMMEIGTIYSHEGVFYLHANEVGGDPAMEGHSWRAVFEINGRLVTATLRDLAGHPISTSDGFRTVERLVEGIIASSASVH